MNERVFRYGENNQGIGMVTLPSKIEAAPVIVMLNAGLLHRAEPYRLNVLACRQLAAIGYICIRVDLSMKGDTPSRGNIPNRESVALDWKFIKKAMNEQFGKRNIIILGICSGADNGIKIAAEDIDVKGLILLDPISYKDQNFTRRKFTQRITNLERWKNLPKTILRKCISKAKFGSNLKNGLRDEPTQDDMLKCFSNLVQHQGRVLAIFTSEAINRYNEEGQFSRALSVNGLDQICNELFWPEVDHIYQVQTHRDLLLKTLNNWCSIHLNIFLLK